MSQSINQGSPPKAVQDRIDKERRLREGAEETEPEPTLGGVPVEELSVGIKPTAEVPMSTTKLKDAVLSNDALEFSFKYIGVEETEFAVLFVLADADGVTVKPKGDTDFTLACEDLSQQNVIYLGSPTYFQSVGLTIFMLLRILQEE